MADKIKSLSDLEKTDELTDKDQRYWQGGGKTSGQLTVDPHKKTEGEEPAVEQAPLKDSKKFEGSGQSLGDETASKATTSVAQQITVDQSKPTTKLQITFANGNRQVIVFNHDHTVSDVRSHLEAIKPCGKPFELKTTYPPQTLENMTITLKDAGLLNASLVQVAQ